MGRAGRAGGSVELVNGVKYMFEPPAGKGASDDDLIVFLVNYVFAV